MAAGPDTGNRLGMAWLLADMVLVTAMTALVKLAGADYPAIQLVFIRSLIGLAAITPLIWRYRAEVLSTRRAGRHSFRVFCNALALTCNFSALTALPLAVVNAIGFMRPLVVTILAVLLLAEKVGAMRWVGVALGFAGVLIIIAPGDIPFEWGLAAAFGSVFFGSMATIQTRALKDENTTVMMVFYTLGLSLLTAVPAIVFWQPVTLGDWPLLIGIGLLAQIAQFCFLKAYQSTPASILAPLGYLSIVLASLTGYLIFSEVPGITMIPGVIVIFVGLQLSTRAEKPRYRQNRND